MLYTAKIIKKYATLLKKVVILHKIYLIFINKWQKEK